MMNGIYELYGENSDAILDEIKTRNEENKSYSIYDSSIQYDDVYNVVYDTYEDTYDEQEYN